MAAGPDTSGPRTAVDDTADTDTAVDDTADHVADPDTADPDTADPDTADPDTAVDDTADPDTVEVPQQAGGTEGVETVDGPLDAAATRRVVRASIAMVATSDVYGERDVTVLAGNTCFLRVLDARHVAWPDEGHEAESAYRANLAEAPELAVLLIGAGEGGGRSGLHLNGTASVVPATDLRVAHPDLPANPVPARSTDVWVVVEVGDAYVLEDDEVPPVGVLRPSSVSRPSSYAAGAQSGGARRRIAPVLVIVLLALLLAAAVVGLGLSPQSSQPQSSQPGSSQPGSSQPGSSQAPAGAPPAAVAPPGPTGPATLYGRVVDVVDPATVVVDVAGSPVRVGVVGLDAATVPSCASSASIAFARTTLQGQTVTLVPDPTLPPPPTRRAYVVLGSQLSYTDAAIRGGHAPAAGPSQYRSGFDDEQRDARAAGTGMWGPPCVR